MSSYHLSLPAFTLLHFTLAQKNGTPAGRREMLGLFTDAESALQNARLRACQMLRHLNAGGEGVSPDDGEFSLCDTEWGYDVRREDQVVERFLVHDRCAHEALPGKAA